ncbi:MAG: Crp/Fnr family transcriptional regulator [Actinobacteria bacterium]|nr:Crp/Fnr family transcriptional regulator [Actinomycetota bacterium]MBW3649831.1 Crp/Fnr family transcriptional regulator [Actinomycetota bacterium]
MSWSFLDEIPDEDRRRVLAATRRRRYGRREVLFHEGDPGDALHLIDKGRVAVRVTTPLGDVVTLNVLGAGRVVGELALLHHPSRRSATVVALEPTQTLTVSRDDFWALRRSHPTVDAFLVNVLAEEIGRLSGLLVEALYVPVANRVLRRLLSLADLYGGARAGTAIPLTQEDLASLAGTSRGTVNRVLGEMEVLGALEVARGRITLIDPALLARRAG